MSGNDMTYDITNITCVTLRMLNDLKIFAYRAIKFNEN